MRIAIGVLSIVLSVVVGFQSLIAGLGNTLSENGESGGSAGFLLSICMLVAGILVLAGKRSKGALITAIVAWIVGALLGFMLAGSYADLVVWSVISLIFAVVTYFVAVRKLKGAAAR